VVSLTVTAPAATAVTRLRPLLAALAKPLARIRSPTLKMARPAAAVYCVGAAGDAGDHDRGLFIGGVGFSRTSAKKKPWRDRCRFVWVMSGDDAAAGVLVDDDALLPLAARS
jgi:hypothetical protein